MNPRHRRPSQTLHASSLAAWALLVITTLSAGSLQREKLQEEFARLTRGFDGRVGVCARDSAGVACVNGSQRFQMMAQTTTFPDRLKAGVSSGWTLAHKTGTSGTWRGVTAATNDVGVLTSPAGRPLSVAVFIADSRASSDDRARLMSSLARAVVENDR